MDTNRAGHIFIDQDNTDSPMGTRVILTPEQAATVQNYIAEFAEKNTPVVRFNQILGDCTYPGYEFAIEMDSRGEMYLQGSYVEADTVSGVDDVQVTRRWLLSPAMTRSELVQTVFKCVITSMEHRVREWFKYKGQPVFGPHFDVDALYQICKDGRFSQRV